MRDRVILFVLQAQKCLLVAGQMPVNDIDDRLIDLLSLMFQEQFDPRAFAWPYVVFINKSTSNITKIESAFRNGQRIDIE